MPPFRPRFTVRRLMIAVAIVSVMLGVGIEGGRIWRQWSTYRARAANASSQEAFHAGLALDIGGHPSKANSQTVSAIVPGGTVQFRSSGGSRKVYYPMDAAEPADEATRRMLIEKCARAAMHYNWIKRKYEDAAQHPWQAVEPDPPEPQ